MIVVSHGNVYDIYDDSLQTHEKLPAQTYVVLFSNQRGFYLEKYVEMEITELKIYGVHLDKVQKVLNSFDKVSRNLGVILSGDKGIGKSLFVKLLAMEAVNKNIPLIVVDTYIPGIASYIESIEQDVMVLFDEFDKTFGEVKSKYGEASPQTNLLTLFDGISGGENFVEVSFNPASAVFDTTRGRHVIMPKDFKLTYYGDDDEDRKDVIASAKSSEPECLIISRKGTKAIHYMV